MSKRLYITCLAVIALLLFPFAIVTYNNMGEDAFISFRYVQNFVDGKGLVFNEGEYVEGYSNFLWVMLLSLPTALGGDLLLWSKLLAVFSNAAMIIMAGLYFLPGKREGDNEDKVNPLLLFAPLVLLFNPTLNYHLGRGLETSFYAALFMGGVFALSRKRWMLASLLLAFLAMTRPEGILHYCGFCALASAAVIVARSSKCEDFIPEEGITWRNVFSLFWPGGIILCVFIIWRLARYGHLFPNTVYAKTATLNFLRNPSIDDIGSFIMAWNGWPMLAALLLIFTWRFNPYKWRTACASAGALAVLSYILLVGKVQASPFRHFVPLVPFVTLIVQAGLLSIFQKAERFHTGIVIAAVIIFILNFFTTFNGDHPASRPHVRLLQFLKNPDPGERWAWYVHPPIHMFSEAGRWVDTNLPEGSLLAADQMGQLGYYARRFSIVDLLGLMDSHIAHEGLSWDYIDARDPDYFVLYGEKGKPFLDNMLALTQLEGFRAKYRLKYVLVSRYREIISNQFLVYGRRMYDDVDAPLEVSVGADSKDWKRWWRFNN